MKIIKGFLITVVVLIVLAVVAGFLSPSHVTVKRSAEMQAPFDVIFTQVNNLKNWNNWSPWHKMDTAMIITYNNIEEGAGASYSWASENKSVGSGDMTITSSSSDSICTAMNFMESGTAMAKFAFESTGASTTVTWSMDMDMGANPVKRLFGLLMDKMLGPDFEAGLSSLKQYAESVPASPSRKFEIAEEDAGERVYIIKRDSVPMDSMPSFFGKNLPIIFEAVGKAKLEMAGAPTGLYFIWDETNKYTVMAAAIPVKGNSKTAVKGFDTYVVPAGKNLHIVYTGGYGSLPAAHMEMDAYMQEKNLLQGIPVIEEYVTDPGNEPDSAKWVTNIYYPVK